jgi:flavodoxin
LNAIVIYESVWGNTAAVARAIAEGLGPDVGVYATDEVPPERLAAAELIVAGAPVFGFSLPTDAMRATVAHDDADAPTPPDLSHPSLRSWLDHLPAGHGRSAAFETRIWWSPRGATGTIENRLTKAGYPPIGKAQKFVVRNKYGPLREGEIERAREWGRELAATIRSEAMAGVA